MAQARMVLTSLWRKSRKFRPLSRNAKLLYLYLITNEDTELCGAYEQHWEDLHRWADLSSEEAQAAFEELERSGLAAYRSGWVLVIDYKVIGANPSVKKGIEAGLADLPDWVKAELDTLSQAVYRLGQAVPTLSQPVTDSDSDSDSDSDYDDDYDYEEEGQQIVDDFEGEPKPGDFHPPEKIPPDGGDAEASLSPLKDRLANHYQERFVAVQPPSSWGNVAKERGQLATLAKKTRLLRTDAAPFEDDVGLANALLSQYMSLRRTESSEYWRNAPFTPSGLATRWDQVVTALAGDHEHAEVWRTA